MHITSFIPVAPWTANVRPAWFPFPLHIETGSCTDDVGEYGNWVSDMTFHGITECYWGHYACAPTWCAMLAVVPREYKPDRAIIPGAHSQHRLFRKSRGRMAAFSPQGETSGSGRVKHPGLSGAGALTLAAARQAYDR